MPAKLFTYVSILALAAGISMLAAFSSSCIGKKDTEDDTDYPRDDEEDEVDETISVTVIEGCPDGDVFPMTPTEGTEDSCEFALIIRLDEDCALDTLTIHGDGRVPSPATVDITRGSTFAFDQTTSEPTMDGMTWSWSRTVGAEDLNSRVQVAVERVGDETCEELGTFYVQLTQSE